MESRNTGEEGAKNDLKDDVLDPDDSQQSSSASSSSSSSGSSEFTFDDTGKNEPGQPCVNNEKCDGEGSKKPKTPDSDTGSTPEASPDTASTLQSPRVQIMDRSLDGSMYRIPSYVFAKNKSSTPMEWSVASNESLFSIHTGNMSYTRDQFNWLLKSGELTNYGELGNIQNFGELAPPLPPDPRKSGELRKSGEQIIATHFKASSVSRPQANQVPDVSVTSSAPSVNTGTGTSSGAGAADTGSHGEPKKEEPKEQMKANPCPSNKVSPLATSVSHHSTASGQSFAFPLLTVEPETDKTVNPDTLGVEQQKKSQSSNEQQQVEPTKAPEKTNVEAAPTTTSWLSYLSCCSRS